MANQPSNADEPYQVAYTTETTNFLNRRRASTQAAFFLPYIQPGMKILDCGCGPGTITVGLAEIVSPAKVIGIDIDKKHLQSAADFAQKKQVENVTFEYGDITNLAFPDASFDAVFVHGVVEYVDAERAFSEIYRMLKKGGVVGARHGDWGGFLIAPQEADLLDSIALFTKFVAHTGGDPYCGRNQFATMRRVGFTNLKVSASYECWTEDQAATRSVANMMATYCSSAEFADPMIKLDLTTRSRLEAISLAWQQWGEDEDAFAAEAWGEAVAWK